ncbi:MULTISPECIES: DUF6307 family protein [unclassified Nocardia]|nr:DUF6307 family protein [Nocardia sp. NBC_01327]
MTTKSPYENRVQRVSDTVRKHSKLDEKTANALAVHVLHALDTIPEKVR